MFPGVPTSVTAGADIPSWTYDSLRRFDRRTRSWLIWVLPPPASALILTDLTPAVLPRAAALLHPFECHRHPSLSFRHPSGYDRIPPPGLTFTSCRFDAAARPGPSHGVLLPPAVISAKDPVCFQGLPRPQPLRPQGSSPLDALIPFTPSRTFLHGAAPGIAPFRALFLPLVRGLFPSTEPSWHCLTRSSNASNSCDGTHHQSRIATPRERVGGLPSGP